MFTTFIVQPIFNLLALIYALLPGHNFGLSIIIFTIVVRIILWPLVRKQLHQAKLMRKLQPEMKRIKKEAAGDKQKEGMLMLELYKERGVNPFAPIGMLILQLPILFGLYSGIHKVILNPHAMVTFSYPAIQHMSWMVSLAHNIHRFDGTLFGVVDLTRGALGSKGVYWPAMVIVVGSAIMQYYQSKQLMPDDKESRGLRAILKDAGSGKQADQSEVNAAVGRSTRYFIPVMIFLVTVNIASALSLYWLVGGLVAYIQQAIVLRDDTVEMEAQVEQEDGTKKVIEGEVISKPAAPKPKKNKQKKRRKK